MVGATVMEDVDRKTVVDARPNVEGAGSVQVRATWFAVAVPDAFVTSGGARLSMVIVFDVIGVLV